MNVCMCVCLSIIGNRIVASLMKCEHRYILYLLWTLLGYDALLLEYHGMECLELRKAPRNQFQPFSQLSFGWEVISKFFLGGYESYDIKEHKQGKGRKK